jgi:hypothetical protein
MGAMKLLALALVLAGCSDSTSSCRDQLCMCPATGDCTHACTPGAPECDVQGTANDSVAVTCDHNSTCDVQCSTSADCNVDCGASASCAVQCPPAGCTVENCSDSACSVSCATGTTAKTTNTTTTCS